MARVGSRSGCDRLRRFSLARERSALRTPETQQLELLAEQDVLFGHLSSNLNGDLLLQTGGLLPESDRDRADRGRWQSATAASAVIRPDGAAARGGGLVVPGYDSLSLQPLVDNGRKPQSLPGSRELGAFCAASGRAVLIRHWPDYRRSMELVIPGLAPRQLWLGETAVLGVACDGSGKRIWAVLGEWSGQRGLHTIIQLDVDGQELQRADLGDWSMKGGTPPSVRSCDPSPAAHGDPIGATGGLPGTDGCGQSGLGGHPSHRCRRSPVA